MGSSCGRSLPELFTPRLRPTRRVLILDDDTRVLQTLGDLVSATEGLAVCGLAAGTQEATAADSENAPDLVLVDVLLPTLDEGLSLTRGLSCRQHPVVALSVSGLARDLPWRPEPQP